MRALMRSNRLQTFTAWIGICAVLLNVCAPLVSRILAAQRGGMSEYAQAHSGHAAHADASGHEHHADGEPTPPSQPHLHLDHCAYCAPHGASYALTASIAPQVLALSIAFVLA